MTAMIFTGHIIRLSMAEKRISEIKNTTIETSKIEQEREKKMSDKMRNYSETAMMNALMSSLGNYTWLNKNSLRLRICQ